MWAILANFPFFAILYQVGKTISPWGEGSSRNEVVILVAYDQGIIALELLIWFSGPAGVMVHASLPNVAFPAVFCPVA